MSQTTAAKEASDTPIEKTITVTISIQADDMLKQLVGSGIFGRTKQEICERFIDEKLLALIPFLRGR
jgi:hypothetical protein